MKDLEFREFNINAKNNDKNIITLEIDTRQSKRFSKENRFLTESIAPDVFIRGIKKDALILLNHQATQVVSNKFEARATDTGVEIDVKLDEKNIFSTTVQSYRENGVPLSVSFGFRCKEERMNGKHREIIDMEIGEISILTVESQYFSSTRSLQQELTMEELQEMVDKSVAKALEPKEKEVKVEPEIAPEPQKIEEKQPQIEQKTLEIKLNADEFKGIFNDFLSGLKEELLPKNEPKIEEKEVKIDQKVEEKPVIEAPQPQKIDDETLQKVEQYKQMLAEMEE